MRTVQRDEFLSSSFEIAVERKASMETSVTSQPFKESLRLADRLIVHPVKNSTYGNKTVFSRILTNTYELL